MALIIVLAAVFFVGIVLVLFRGAGPSSEWDEMSRRQEMVRALNGRRETK